MVSYMALLPHNELDLDGILEWLREEGETRLETLWNRADETRRANVGDAVHLRGLVEFSNICARRCGYCGLRVTNAHVNRYRMSEGEIVGCARKAVRLGYGTLVLQSGEDRGVTMDWLTGVIRRIKHETGLAVTLSVGERDPEELAAWRWAGADRYLLRFETSSDDLFGRIHPSLPGKASDRIALLQQMRALGYEVGSGAMIGIPGQTVADVARDIMLFRELDLDMIGVGPFLPHPDTPLGAQPWDTVEPVVDQAPNSELMTYKVIALTRLVCPRANIPSTTALATINKQSGRELGLQRGANVVMPNLTPPKYRREYTIYPDKACLTEDADHCSACMRRRIASIGRTVGAGHGDSPNAASRRKAMRKEPAVLGSRSIGLQPRAQTGAAAPKD